VVATLILRNEHIKDRALHFIKIAPVDTMVKFYSPKRTIPQNDKMWAMLSEIADQADLNGVKHTPETWKAIFMNGLGHEIRFVLGMNDEPFPVGFRSSKLSKDQMKDLIELIYMFGAENGVEFNDI